MASKLLSGAAAAGNNGVKLGLNPSDSSASSGKNTSDSERTHTADLGAFLNVGRDENEVQSRRAQGDQESDSERTQSAIFGQIPNVGYDYHFSEVDCGALPGGRENKVESFQTKRKNRGTIRSENEAHLGDSRYMEVDSWMDLPRDEDRNGHAGKIDHQTVLPVETKIPLPKCIVDHKNKEVDKDGWTIEVRPRTKGNARDKYYRHKDYDHVFRSKAEIKLFLDTGMVKRRNVLQILCKRSAGPNVHSSGRSTNRSRTTNLNSGSNMFASDGKAPESTEPPHGFV